MSWTSELGKRLLMLLRRQQFETDLEEEMRLHRELSEQERAEAGASPEEAHYVALRRFGNVALTKERSREMWGWSALENTIQDVRYGLRQLRRSPGFTAVVVLILALGIGANTAIFTLIDAVMLKSLPVANPSQLYRLGDDNNCCVMTGTQNGGSFVLYSYPLYEELRDHTPEFSELAAFESYLSDLSVRRRGASAAAEPYKGEYVSGNYFTMFGIRAFAGRLLAPLDDSSGAPRMAVMSYHTWQQHFGLDPSVIGSTFDINGSPYTIAGVTPPRFYGDRLRSDPPDFWLPLAADPDRWLFSAEPEWLYLIGRLRPDVAPERVQARLTVELQQWLNSRPEVIPERDRGDIPKQHVHLTPAPGGVDQMQRDYAAGLRLLVTIAALVLLIACANIANLLLARAMADRPQTALRLALGAPRARLIRQKLTESILLAGRRDSTLRTPAAARSCSLLFAGHTTSPSAPSLRCSCLGSPFSCL
jgi:macrolide transport system ATP-binding/permease protein